MSRLCGMLCCLVTSLAVIGIPASVRAGGEGTQGERIARLIRALGDDDFDARQKAEQDLRKLGEATRDALTKAQGDRDPEVRSRAAKALGVLDASKAAALPPPLPVRMVKDVREPAPARPVEPESKTPQAPVVREVDPKRIARLVEELNHEKQPIRANAETQLGRIGEPALGALLDALKHEDLEVRRRAGRLLAPICKAKAEGLLAQLSDVHPGRRAAAARELTKLMADDAERLQQQAAFGVLSEARKSHPEAKVRQKAGEVLARHRSVVITRLIDQLGDDNFASREAAEAQLLRVGLPALGQLMDAAASEDLEVRQRARRLVQRLEAAR